MPGILPKSATFAWPTLDLDPEQIPKEFAKFKGCKYKLGAKAHIWHALGIWHAEPTENVKAIDCSGATRLALFRARGVMMPDGSWGQGDWALKQGFKRSDVAAGRLKDDVLRLAVLPQQPGKGVGRHVLFILNGITYESYGGHGPGSRVWTGRGYQAKCLLWVLTAPKRVLS